MTSYTKKLHEIDPATATAIHRQEYSAYRYGRHVTLAQFTPAHHQLPRVFGKRTRYAAVSACAQLCGHPACSQGCVGRSDLPRR